MPRLVPILAIVLAFGIAGAAINSSSLGLELEESVGLNILFHMRGPRPAPPEVVIVAFDQESANNLELPPLPRKWPRRIFADLVESLARAEPAVIVFDIHFGDMHSPEEDRLVAEAMGNAGNVVLCEYLKRDVVSSNEEGVFDDSIYIERTMPPISPLAEAALGLAPFPLPKPPIRVSQFWTFKPEAGGKPTLPVVAFQAFALDPGNLFLRFLEKSGFRNGNNAPQTRETLIANRNLGRFVMEIRDFFLQDPGPSGQKLSTYFPDFLAGMSSPQEKAIVQSLNHLYRGPENRFLDFYGPPRTIRTIPLYKLLKESNEIVQLELKGKAVFIGLSEVFPTDQRDGFHTVFSQPDGTDLSGVEIAGTAFGNLLEDRLVRPLALWESLLLVFGWGALAGGFCLLAPTFVSAAVLAACSIGYLFFAQYHFALTGAWYPVAIPLLIQAPLAFILGLGWHYFAAEKARRRTRKAFELYLPSSVIEQIVGGAKGMEASSETVLGAVLCSDATQYTAFAENMNPKELNLFLNRYYEVIFGVVKRHGGMVSDIIGDSMLAVWTTSNSGTMPQRLACKAALETSRALDEFNRQSSLTLHTQFGLHFGPILLGHIGGVDRYEYRPVGDVVNTTARIEGLNKLLGTRILASEEVLDDSGQFIFRGLGRFLFAGKFQPITVFELICSSEEFDERDKNRCALFARALGYFQNRDWDQALSLFNECHGIDKTDRASLFYADLCRVYRDNPPDLKWDGLITLGER